HEFEDLPMEHDILSFIRDLGYSRDIIYLTDVSVDYLHQPWRAFSTIINKCLSGKETRMDKFRLSRTQILWGDGTDFESRVLDEQHLKTTSADEGIEDEDDENDSVDKSDGNNDDEGGSDDHDNDCDDERTDADRDQIHDPNLTNVEQTEQEEEEYSDQRVYTPSDYELSEKEKMDDEEKMDEEEDDEITKELYKDVNINLGNKGTKISNVDQGGSCQQNVSQGLGFEQVEEDAHVTLTPVFETQKTDKIVQSSFVSSHFTSKILDLKNPSPADNEMASLMDTTARHATIVPKITSCLTTTIPPPPLSFNPLPQQATLTLTPIISKATTSFPSLLDFSYVFRFKKRVTNLEKDLPEIKQIDQYAQAISSILAIVDPYMDNKLDEVIYKAIQSHNAECRKEAQAKKQEYINNFDLRVRTIIREEVKT
nr:hypothetical protein [Tanacetum cinerariifolium]